MAKNLYFEEKMKKKYQKFLYKLRFLCYTIQEKIRLFPKGKVRSVPL